MTTVYNLTYRFIELAAMFAGKMVRNHFVPADQGELIRVWFNQYRDADWFTSVSRYSQPTRQSQWIAPMFFDIDAADNLEQARSDALTLCLWLKDWFKIAEECMDIYFSGGKGMHVLISTKIFTPADSTFMLQAYKYIANKAVEAGVTHLDTGVYTYGRLLRVPNSRHTKTKLWKIPLTFEELRDLGMARILELARQPRPQNSYAMPVFCSQAADLYKKLVADCQKTDVSPLPAAKQMTMDFIKGWRMTSCIKKIEESTVPDGIRHPLYVELCRYYAYLKMHPDEMLERIQRIDSRNPIKDQDAIERAVQWGCRHPGFPGCDTGNLKKYCNSELCFYAKIKSKRKC